MEKLWSSECEVCCMECYIRFDKCLCSCINNKIYCSQCEKEDWEVEENV